MTVNFRFRIHRIGSRFPDKKTLDVFVLSNGKVNGTVRNLEKREEGFRPVLTDVDASVVAEMKTLFDLLDSSDGAPWINVGMADHGSQLRIKSFAMPSESTECKTFRFWGLINGICEKCISGG